MKNIRSIMVLSLAISSAIMAGQTDLSSWNALPEDIKKELIKKVESLEVLKNLELSTKSMQNLILSMAQKRELNPQIQWAYEPDLEARDLVTGNEVLLSVALSPDKKMLVTGGDRVAEVWDIPSGEVIHRFPHLVRSFSSVVLTPDKQVVGMVEFDRPAVFYDLPSQNIRSLLEGYSLTRVALSDDKEIALTCGATSGVRIWQLNSQTSHQLVGLGGYGDLPIAIALSPDKKIAIAGTTNGAIAIWETDTGRLKFPVIRVRDYGKINSIAISADSKYFIIGTAAGVATIVDLATGRPIKTLGEATQDNQVRVAVMSPDKKMVVTGHDDTSAKIWDVKTGKIIKTLVGHSGPVYTVALSPDKKMIITGGSGDGLAKIWDID